MKFAYCRVSTIEQDTKNQLLEITNAGFVVDEVVNEYCSGSLPIARRKAFSILMTKLRKDDVLIVTKLDRLGRNVIDIQQTLKELTNKGVKVHCLALNGVDLTSSSGTLIVSILGAIAQFERDLIVERTQAGLLRAKEQGKKLGRPSKLSKTQIEEITNRLKTNQSIRSLSIKYNISRTTIRKLKEKVVKIVC